MLDLDNLQEKNGSVGCSPSATAYFVLEGKRGEPRAIGVRIAPDLGLRQPRGVDKRGMVEPVFEDNAVALRERRRHAQIRHVAGGEKQRALRAHELGELLLERMVRARVAAHEVRGPRAHAVALRAALKGGDDLRVIGEPEIIVAAKGEQRLFVHAQLDALGRIQDQALAIELRAAAARQLLFQVFHGGFTLPANGECA